MNLFVRLLLLLMMTLAGMESAMCQDYNRADGVRHGLRIGGTFANLTTSAGDEYLPNTLDTYYFGYIRESPFLPFMRFGAGLEFYQLGGRDGAREQVKLSYLSIPLMLKVKIGPFFAMGGYQGAIRVHAVEIVGDVRMDPENGKYSRWNAGPYVGAGAQFLVFFIEGRYTWGREGIVDNFRGRQWQLGGGIIF